MTVEDEKTLGALEQFWKLFAARYRGRHVIFAYDLKNEPELGWDSAALTNRWNDWLKTRYSSTAALSRAWGETNAPDFGNIPVPSDKVALTADSYRNTRRFGRMCRTSGRGVR